MTRGAERIYAISLAAADDIDAITALLQANSPSSGGSLYGEFPRDKVARMALCGSPVVVARYESRVVGVLFSAAKDSPAAVPILHAMLSAWPGSTDAYLYGPICIAELERGRGLPRKLYEALKRRRPGREAILFIRRDNAASLRAHQRLGMREVASFVFDGERFAVYSDRTSRPV